MDELSEFISILNAECRVLQARGEMVDSVDEPWRYYSAPLDDEHEFEHLRAVIESGKLTVEAEALFFSGNDKAWSVLAKAQQSLLRSLSVKGKAQAKKNGQSRGGEFKNEEAHFQVFCIADNLLAAAEEEGGENARKLAERGLAKKVVERLNSRFSKTENQVREILKSQKHLLVNR